MAGHSKWNNIQHRKGAQDKQRSKIFTKYAKLIAIAARNGADPEMNAPLKQAIASAKADNVPNDNITRAIKKASGEGKDAAQYVELEYEAYAPGGVALIIEALSDNSNRAFTSVRTAVTKNGGNMAATNAVNWSFKDQGHLEIPMQGKNQENVEMDVIEAGAEDVEFGEDAEGNLRAFVSTHFEDLGSVRDYLLEKGYVLENIKKHKEPETKVQISEEAAEKLLNLIEKIEEDDDVTEVFHNAEIV